MVTYALIFGDSIQFSHMAEHLFILRSIMTKSHVGVFTYQEMYKFELMQRYGCGMNDDLFS